MATLTKSTGTVILSGAVEKITLPAVYGWVWFWNMSEGDMFAGTSADISKGADGVATIPAGGYRRIQTDGFSSIYLLGTGNVQIAAQNYADCPFKAGLRGGDPDQLLTVSAAGNPVTLNGLQGGVPFNSVTVSGDDIVGQELTVNVCGKNLLKTRLSSFSNNGVTAVVNDDGSVTINRTETSERNSYIQLWNNMSARSIGTKKITINAVDGQSLESCFMGIDRLENGTYLDRAVVGIINNGVGMVTQEDIDNDRLFRSWVFIHKDYSPNNLIIYPQLELGDTATEYEPYNGSTTAITPDSNPYVIPNDIRQVDGLNNVSVSDGEISVVGVRKNAAIKNIWDKIDELTTAIIVSNGESE